MGVWTLFMASASYVASVLDGVVTSYASWRWMQWITVIMWGALLPFCALLPETMYYRSYSLTDIPARETYLQRLKWKKFGLKLTLESFYRPFRMLKYPPVFIIGTYYGIVYGFCLYGALAILPFVSLLHRIKLSYINELGFRRHIWIWCNWARPRHHCSACRYNFGRANSGPILGLGCAYPLSSQ
jgi:hypothetical protein